MQGTAVAKFVGALLEFPVMIHPVDNVPQLERQLEHRLRDDLPGTDGHLRMSPEPRSGWVPGSWPDDARDGAALLLLYPYRDAAHLVLTLRDLGRPQQGCSREHPLSGCATVDWSDFDGRPNVPPGGVFEHRLVLQLASGAQAFFLSDSGSLNEAPDRYKPG